MKGFTRDGTIIKTSNTGVKILTYTWGQDIKTNKIFKYLKQKKGPATQAGTMNFTTLLLLFFFMFFSGVIITVSPQVRPSFFVNFFLIQ